MYLTGQVTPGNTVTKINRCACKMLIPFAFGFVVLCVVLPNKVTLAQLTVPP